MQIVQNLFTFNKCAFLAINIIIIKVYFRASSRAVVGSSAVHAPSVAAAANMPFYAK